MVNDDAGPVTPGDADEWDPAIYQPEVVWVEMTPERLARRRAYDARPYVEPAVVTPIVRVREMVARSNLARVGPFAIEGWVVRAVPRASQSGDWAIIEVRDGSDSIMVFVFPRLYDRSGRTLVADTPVRVHGYGTHAPVSAGSLSDRVAEIAAWGIVVG